MFRRVFFIVFISSLPSLWALDRYAALESLLPREKMPRLLNSEDLTDLSPFDPQPLLSPAGDFTRDGSTEAAISGIYGLPVRQAGLPTNNKRYFLLVAANNPNGRGYLSLFFEEYPRPVYIHKAGTTGEGDPGDQAFSISFCSNCNEGFDFYWAKETARFSVKAWEKEKKRLQIREKPETAAQDVPDEAVDAALRLAGALKDVQDFVNGVKERGGKLGTRVTPHKKSKKKRRYWVHIYEKKGEEEILFAKILVDIKKKKILKKK